MAMLHDPMIRGRPLYPLGSSPSNDLHLPLQRQGRQSLYTGYPRGYASSGYDFGESLNNLNFLEPLMPLHGGASSAPAPAPRSLSPVYRNQPALPIQGEPSSHLSVPSYGNSDVSRHSPPQTHTSTGPLIRSPVERTGPTPPKASGGSFSLPEPAHPPLGYPTSYGVGSSANPVPSNMSLSPFAAGGNAVSQSMANNNRMQMSRSGVLYPSYSFYPPPYDGRRLVDPSHVRAAKRRHNCVMCGKVFARPSALQTHIYSHTGEKPFRCEHHGCGRSFSVVSNLRRHQRVHVKTKLK